MGEVNGWNEVQVQGHGIPDVAGQENQAGWMEKVWRRDSGASGLEVELRYEPQVDGPGCWKGQNRISQTDGVDSGSEKNKRQTTFWAANEGWGPEKWPAMQAESFRGSTQAEPRQRLVTRLVDREALAIGRLRFGCGSSSGRESDGV